MISNYKLQISNFYFILQNQMLNKKEKRRDWSENDWSASRLACNVAESGVSDTEYQRSDLQSTVFALTRSGKQGCLRSSRKRHILLSTNFHLLKILFVLCLFCISNFAQSLPVAAPNTVGMSAEKLNQIDGLVEKAIADKKMPGAVVVVGHKGKIVYRKAFGNRALEPTVEKMTVDTIFDVASLTKVVATTTSIMKLVEDGKVRLNDTIGDFFPEIEDKEVRKVTVQQLLTHTSGFRPDFDLREKWTGRDGMLDALKRETLRNPPGTKFVYSDIGFIVLGEIIERISKEDVSDIFAFNML